MSRLPDCFAPKPLPKPISAARWVPLAKKHGLNIEWETKCVGNIGITEFWGGPCFEPDVGACVVKVAKMIEASAERKSP
ncbi:hypothetical protein SKZ59_07490 [Janthinobacterium sp. GMG2]|uniref:hypothetical protein n=1 Tax=Janthinobacterium sp. GMG2 TaxID=3096606 RepID=UPI0029F4C40F|nr:hypothetical protein [Janthinobacterium sp. GMG2]MDX8121607.1 hypothetical protein [Janthinobacterium sp. GMG2]